MKWSSLSESEQNLTRVSGALFVVAAIVWTSVFVAPLLNTKQPRKRGGVVWAKPAPGEAEARWADINRLREKMRPWAERNRDNLSRMRGADATAFRSVYDAIPMWPDEKIIGISSEDTLEFTWNCHVEKDFAKDIAKADSITANRLQSSVTWSKFLLDYNQKKYRDIALSDTWMSGRLQYTLWASGRITKSMSPERCKGNLKCLAEREHDDLVPAYDFVGERK